MEIIGHLIKDTEIIGIGPVYMEHSKDQIMISLYNSFRYVFDVHCKSRSVQIQSDFFKPSQNDEVARADEKKKYTAWKEEYYRARRLVADQIGEIIPDQK